MKDEYIAHISEDGRIQTVENHAKGTAEKAALFADVFGWKNMAYSIGIAHDLGKYSVKFQEYIRNPQGKPKTDHSSAGAKEIFNKYGADAFSYIAAYCISGHHSGLLNGGGIENAEGTLSGRMKKRLEPYCDFRKELSLAPPERGTISNSKHRGYSIAFLIRMLFSCLVDADFLDTEAFMKGSYRKSVSEKSTVDLCRILDEYINIGPYLKGGSEINNARKNMLLECIQRGDEKDRGLFTLTIPTGGGKTLDSLAFALHQSKEKGLSRVIYVIPYCSIIDQTVAVFEDIVGCDNVLAHYSEASYDENDSREAVKKLAAENWDAPIIVTTAVQFFESLYSNRTSKCRKLHNIANSIVVFDEAQLMPVEYLRPCVYAIAELIKNYKCSCILCTATQPALSEFFKEHFPDLKAEEIAVSAPEYADLFKRVSYDSESLKEGDVLTDEVLAEMLGKENQALCVVPTRKQALAVYKLLDDPDAIHLSTMLTPFDRKNRIRQIRKKLKNNERCIVVSTSLIEAGVDLDFPTVYRAEAGLDSMIQAAGRCNREGKRKREESVVHLFKPDPSYKIPPSMARPRDEADVLMKTQDLEPDDPRMIHAYFENLYRDSGNLDARHVVEMLDKKMIHIEFADCGDQFHLINNDTWAVMIPENEESIEVANRLQDPNYIPTKTDYRIAGKYSVNVYSNDFKTLQPYVQLIAERFAVLTVEQKYTPEEGLDVSGLGGYEIIF